MAKIIPNQISIQKKCINAVKAPRYVNFFRGAANTRFVIAKEQMLEEFDDHVVTKELLEPTSPSELISHGSLYSFIGFENGSNPTAELRLFLKENTQLSRNVEIQESNKNINFIFDVEIPTVEEINDTFPAPWSSQGWVAIIEKGLKDAASAAYYIFSLEAFKDISRSGYGIQSKRARKAGGNFRPVKYISQILNNFRSKFK